LKQFKDGIDFLVTNPGLIDMNDVLDGQMAGMGKTCVNYFEFNELVFLIYFQEA